MKNVLLQLNQNEINLIKEIATEWFNMKNVSGDWTHNWEAAVKIYYRMDGWSDDKFIKIEDCLLDEFKVCIQDYVSQGFKNDIGFKKYSVGKFLFIKIMEALEDDFPIDLLIPLTYEGVEKVKIIVDPRNHPTTELAKHGIFINNGNKN